MVPIPLEDLAPWMAKGQAAGIPTRGIADHGFVHSIYFRDPNGCVIELTAKVPGHERDMDPAQNGAAAVVAHWQKTKRDPSV